MKKRLFSKVIAGKYKSKPILLPSLNSTRSSKSILKESFFSSIAFDIVDSDFVEVFGGSGQIAIEALSRGAKKVFIIEKDREAYKILLQNLNSLKNEEFYAYNEDSFEYFTTMIQNIDKAFFYFDPPFSIRDGYSDVYNKIVSLIASIKKEKVIKVCIEHMSSIKFPDSIGVLIKTKEKKFGKSTLTYYTVPQI